MHRPLQITMSREQEDGEFFLKKGEVGVGGDEGGALEQGEGGGEAVGVGEFVLSFEFGGEAGLFEFGGDDGYWKVGDLLDDVVGDAGTVGTPNGVVSFAPVNHAHQQSRFSVGGLMEQPGELFRTRAILKSTKGLTDRVPGGGF